MLSYLTREDTEFALRKMQQFHHECIDLHNRHGLDLLENLGRRNILLSSVQEKFFADALARRYTVTNDGRPGEPDIVIETLDRELECKLTSRHRSGAISFQTDYETLVNKGKLDYLYMVASEDFKKFAIIHYTDLTAADFRGISPGSRGKSQMMKYAAHDRANVVIGKMVNLNEVNIKKLNTKLRGLSHAAVSARKKIQKSMDFWKNSNTRFSVELEKI